MPIAIRTATTVAAKTRYTTITARPRGSLSRVKSRTSGLSVNAITEAVRNRKSTCPSVWASRKTRTRRAGSPTSWTQRGILIVGPGPAMPLIVSRRATGFGGRDACRRACYGPDVTTPRSRHAARLRARRQRAQARARWLALAVVVAVLLVATLAVTAFSGNGPSGATTVSGPSSGPVTTPPPEPLVLATVGNLRVQSPIAQEGVTTVGFHGS